MKADVEVYDLWANYVETVKRCVRFTVVGPCVQYQGSLCRLNVGGPGFRFIVTS